ncbi:peptidoglycan-binding protein [Gammaproteobacteria bacterium 45_16_T64]|nr:peptidoglycan-binding protein [Gammaproteobacteria bacterium 45_16_T64]
MMKSFLRLMGVGLLGLSLQAAADVELKDNHPTTYNVSSGDTLWDISNAFLKNPWLWPELWFVNPQIDNPHLIYPGDVLKLIYVDGRPYLNVEPGPRTIKFKPGDTIKLTPHARITPIDTVIPAIPLEHIQSFLVNNRVLDKDELNLAPYILAGDEDHILMGVGSYMYARGDWEENQKAYGVYRRGPTYLDPETNEMLGFAALDLGIVRFESKENDIARFKVQSSNEDIRVGDRLLPTEERKVNSTFYPKAPSADIDGEIIHVFSGVKNVSLYDVVVINRGIREGVEIGDVLAVFAQGEVVKDRVTKEMIKLPDHRRGMLMVFRTFEKTSYGLVLKASAPLAIADRVSNPS